MFTDRALLDAVRDAIVLADIDTGMIVDANRAAELLFGRSADELRSLHQSELHPSELADSARRRFAEQVRSPGLIEGWVLHKDGHWLPVEIASSQFTASNGLRLLIGVFRDISERFAAREELRRSEERFRQIAESAGEFIWEVDNEGLYLYANPVVEQILGYTPEELVGKMHFFDLFAPDKREEMKAAALGAFAQRKAFRNFLNWNLRKDGKVVALETTGVPILDVAGVHIGYRGADRDVTERERAGEALRESERRSRAQAAELQAIMDAAPAVIVIAHDPECRRVGGNRMAHASARQLLGANLSNSVLTAEGTNLRFMRDGVEIAPTELPLPRAAATGKPIRNYEMRMAFADGAGIELLGNVEPLFDENGRPRGAVGVFSDITERKKAEAALRESEERFRNMADTAPVMVWVAGPDKLCTFFNKPWLDFTGRTLEQEIGDGWLAGIHPDDRDRCLSVYSECFDARRSFQIEYRLRRADGTYRWILGNGAPRCLGGAFAGFISSCIDVTERKLMEDRLKLNERRLVEAQRLAKVGSWEREVASGKLHWSGEMFRIYGLPNGDPPDFSELLGHIHPKDRGKVVGIMDQVRSSAASVSLECRIIRPDGEVRFVRTVLEGIRDTQGELLRLVGATQDITDEVLADQLLRESEERLRSAERLAHVGHWSWDIKTKHIAFSDELFRILGEPHNSRPGYGTPDVIAPQDRDRVLQWGEEWLTRGQAGPIDVQIVRPGGEVRTVTCVGELLLDEDGSPARLFGSVHDITEERRAQQESFARQKLESIGTLAGGIAHDFNNLLGGILAQAELAQVEFDAGASPERALEDIKNVAMRGSEIVRQLMIYAGRESEARGPVDVNRIVREMIELLRVSISKSATLETDLGEDLPMISGGAAQLRQIVMNLVTNASEALTAGDGTIRVTTRAKVLGRAEAVSRGLVEGGYIQLEVLDTGMGIPPELQPRVFDPFFTTKSKGHGLGLAVVHGMVQNLRGSVHLTSEPGKGTIFRILLPAAERPAGRKGTDRRAVGPAVVGTEATVLVVEDEDPLRDALVKMLRRSGFSVLEASDGSIALDLLRAHEGILDIVLLDVTIPGAPSRDVVAEAARLHPEAKVVVTSAHSKSGAELLMSPRPVDRFVRKPFHLVELVQSLRDALLEKAPGAG